MEILIFIPIIFIIYLINIHNKKNELEKRLEKQKVYTETIIQERNQQEEEKIKILAITKVLKDNYEIIALENEELKKIDNEKFMCFPWLSKAYEDYFELKNLKEEKFLRNKKRPATTAADKVKELRNKYKEQEKNYKLFEYKIKYYEEIYPELTNLIAQDQEEEMKVNSYEYNSVNNEKDIVSRYLTNQQYADLPENERNQLALDNYKKRKKSKSQIGRDYERYCGYLWEKEGFKVEYKGIIDGFDDLGRDLIAKKDNETHIIQCKYWAEWKEIHEKHIFQLFGTTIQYCLEENIIENKNINDIYDFVKLLKEKKVIPYFVTKTTLSERCSKIAKKLNIEVIEELRIEEYPIIKCHLKGKDKIYHLPMDQQYDKIKIDNKNTFYVNTVQQAINKGCRRAYKHNFNS